MDGGKKKEKPRSYGVLSRSVSGGFEKGTVMITCRVVTHLFRLAPALVRPSVWLARKESKEDWREREREDEERQMKSIEKQLNKKATKYIAVARSVAY